MFDLRALHSVTIELHGGMLTLAFVCIVIKVIDMLWARFLGERGGIVQRVLRKASEYSTPTILLAAIGGVIGLLLSGYTGSQLVPSDSLNTSPITLNKVMVTIIAVELWSVMILFNIAHREKAWEGKGNALFMVMSGGIGYFFSITGGSLGGTMAGKVSIMEPLWEFLGVDLHASWILGYDLLLVLVLAVNILGILLVAFSSKIAKPVVTTHETSE